jgi:hypothetical protein
LPLNVTYWKSVCNRFSKSARIILIRKLKAKRSFVYLEVDDIIIKRLIFQDRVVCETYNQIRNIMPVNRLTSFRIIIAICFT